MFDALARGFRAAREKLTGIAELSEDNIDGALRDVRLSLLEADVELGVVKRFLARVKEQAIGQSVALRAQHGEKKVTLSAADHFIKICSDEMVRLMSAEDGEAIVFAPAGQPTVIMMVGLQGQGKTTTSAKIARLFVRDGKKVLLVAADLQRPAAVEQLEILGKKVDVPVFKPARMDMSPVEVCKQGLAVARVQKRDVVIFDTAGRLAVDERLMQELADIKKDTSPHNILLVCNAAAGQNTLGTAQAFHERLGLTGAVLTMLDGDARGGAALSIREVTSVPIKFVGTGEHMDRLEPFRAEGMASRILGFGDVIGLYNDFKNVVDEKQAAQDAMRMLRDEFTFDDFLNQVGTIRKMGPIKDLLEKIPFASEAMSQGMNVDEREFDRVESMIRSMTKAERANSALFEQPGRAERVARGSGSTVEQVQDLVQKFNFMKGFMGNIGKQVGLLGKLPGAKQLAMANRLRKMLNVEGGDAAMQNLAKEMVQAGVAGGGMPGMSGMPGFGGMPGMGGGGMPDASMLASMFGGGPEAAAGPRKKPEDKDKKKQARKAERDARKKGRKR
ncbi:MAG: signal recognition particle protein [Deltaproteobacteria bacterium]|nr:signal recognition particle protein [Deltaproteobacteria bacterium]